MNQSKHCNACRRVRHASKFGRNRKRHDGLQSQCLECRAAKAVDRRRRERER